MNRKSKKTQRNRILQFLEINPGATNLDIAIALRISSSSKRLSELMRLGIVESVREDGSRFCRYYLRKEEALD